MSGPTTAVYEASDTVIASAGLAAGFSAVMLAARAIKEARDIHSEYSETYQRVVEREKERNLQRQQLREAYTQRIATLHRQADRLQAKLTRLQQFLQKSHIETTPCDVAPPTEKDEAVWRDYLSRLESAIILLEQQLPALEVDIEVKFEVMLAEMPDIHQLLAAYAQQQAYKSRLSAEESAYYQKLANHLLTRLTLPSDETLPVRIETLAREMVSAHDVNRAEALATELRLEIQRANQQREQQKTDSEEANLLLSLLADALPVGLREELEQVAAGVNLLDSASCDLACALLEEVKVAQKREEQEAIAIVLEQSLRDLGYEVEDISHTLFVSGGMVHFQKSSWQNYYVRLRVSAKEKTINFNVVRSSGDAAQEKHLDYLAEDRWCAEFPTLLKTLEARGVNLNVTRRLQAGEVPVQIVKPETLPVFRKEEAYHPTVAAKQMNLDGK